MPIDDAPCEDIDHEGDVDQASPGRHVGQIGHPQLIGCGRCKLPLDQVGGPSALEPPRDICFVSPSLHPLDMMQSAW